MALQKRPQIVVIGAGFGGLHTALNLARFPVEVLILDRNNYHTFSPLLHQVATAELEPEQIIHPVRHLLRQFSNVRFITTEVQQINFAAQLVETDQAWIAYDFLVLATGSTSQFLGTSGAAEYAFPLKSLEQAVALRNHILNCFEQAVQEPNLARRQKLLTFTIVGGGPTGVEFAGALAELIHHSLVKDYSTLDFREVRLLLLQSGDSLLPYLPDRLRRYTLRQLRHRGVEVLLHTRVERVMLDAVQLENDKLIPTTTVVWTAGVQADPLAKVWGLPTVRAGRVAVLPTLQVLEHPHVYAVGDVAHLEQDEQSLPMLAQVAIQQGKAVARNIARQVQGKISQPFRYRELGKMAMIGRHSAVAQISRFSITGFLAWFLWLEVHLLALPGWRNRLMVLLNWVWTYVSGDRAIRLFPPTRALASKYTYLTPESPKQSNQGRITPPKIKGIGR